MSDVIDICHDSHVFLKLYKLTPIVSNGIKLDALGNYISILAFSALKT